MDNAIAEKLAQQKWSFWKWVVFIVPLILMAWFSVAGIKQARARAANLYEAELAFTAKSPVHDYVLIQYAACRDGRFNSSQVECIAAVSAAVKVQKPEYASQTDDALRDLVVLLERLKAQKN